MLPRQTNLMQIQDVATVASDTKKPTRGFSGENGKKREENTRRCFPSFFSVPHLEDEIPSPEVRDGPRQPRATPDEPWERERKSVVFAEIRKVRGSNNTSGRGISRRC